jgi:hypothetical protein
VTDGLVGIMRSLTVLVALVVGLSSCSAAITLPMYERRPDGAVDLAAIRGQLVLDGRCLMLRTSDGANHLLAWPYPGTAWNAFDASVTIDGMRLRPGETITVGGGEYDSPRRTDKWVVPPPRGCWREKRWLVEGIR